MANSAGSRKASSRLAEGESRPGLSTSSNQSAVAADSKCPRCKIEVKSDEKGVCCETCTNWYHIACEGITNDLYKIMIKEEYKSLHWFCSDCETATLSTAKAIHAMKLKQDSLESELTDIKGRIDVHTTELKSKVSKSEVLEIIESKIKELDSTFSKQSDLESAIEIKISEQISKQCDATAGDTTWASVVSKQVDTRFEQVSNNLDEVKKVLHETKSKALEEREKEARTNNVIIYRIPECNDTSQSRDEQIKYDKSFAVELINDVLEVEFSEADLKRVFRLGKPGDNTRPLLIEFKERVLKNRVMESLSKLRRAEDKFKNISVTHDLTRQERAEVKELVEQAKLKQQQEQGEWLWRVRGNPGLMKVVRIPKK